MPPVPALVLRTVLAAGVALLLAGCAAAPTMPPPQSSSLDLSLTRVSPNKHFTVTLVPPAETVRPQQFTSWQIQVKDAAGQPLTQALVYVNGDMPEHGHGLPARPQVTKEIAPGTYQLEGLKFSMTGWWEIYVAVQKVPASDVTTFNFIVPLPDAR